MTKSGSLYFPAKEITGRVNEALCYDFPFDQEVAQPLFDAGMRISNVTERVHWMDKATFQANCNMFTILIQGAMTATINGNKHILKPGDLAYYGPQDTVHQETENAGAWWIYLYFFDVALWKPMHRRGYYIRQYESMELVYLLLKRISAARKTRSITDIMHAREDASILVSILKREIPLSRPKPDRRAARLKELVAEIAAKPEAKWSTTSMARQLNISARQLTRLFQREYGVAPFEMVIKHRLMAATQMLATTNKTIESIAHELDYSSFHTFSALFKKHIGASPTEFRRMYKDSVSYTE